MILYEVNPPPLDGDPEGKDITKWFSSKIEAEKCFRQHIKEIKSNPDDFAYYRITLSKIIITNLPHKTLVLNILNRCGFVSKRVLLKEYNGGK